MRGVDWFILMAYTTKTMGIMRDQGYIKKYRIAVTNFYLSTKALNPHQTKPKEGAHPATISTIQTPKNPDSGGAP